MAPTIPGIPSAGAYGYTSTVEPRYDQTTHAYSVVSTSSSVQPTVIQHTMGDRGSNGTMYSFFINDFYQATDIGTPTSIGMVPLSIQSYVGSAASGISATGSFLGFESSVYVKNTSQAGAEHSPMFSVLRYDQGTGFSGSGTPGRGWLTDWTVHSAIDTQHEVINGINIVMANYRNGQPSSSPMGAIWIQAGNSIGGSLDATHAAATRYPAGVGIGIVGNVAGGTGHGYDVGIQIGGSGGGWGVVTSKLGKGLTVRDYDTAGAHFFTRSGSTAPAIQIDSDGGHILLAEQTDPAAPAANSGALYVRDNGGGKSQLVIRFPTGAIQVIATEP